MAYVVFFTLVLLITILSVYLVIENNRRKAREAEKRAFNERVKEITNHFKSKVSEYVAAKILRPKYAPQVNAIVSNFFVVQAHNEDNLEQLERVSDQFTHCVTAELIKCQQNGNIDLLEEQLQYFIAELPSAGIAYNRDFYREILPALIARIQTPDTPAMTSDSGDVEEDKLAAPDDSNGEDKKAPTQSQRINPAVSKALS